MRLAVTGGVLTLALLAGPLPHGAPQSQAGGPVPLSILFVGNSLTATNDLPGMVEALGRAVDPPVHVSSSAVVRSGYSLADHWKDGAARRALRQRRWTYLVLQQGPSSLPASRESLRDYVRRFSTEAGRQGTAVALYSVWPPRGRLHALDAVTASYSEAAPGVGARIAPVGEAWRTAWQLDPALPLYADDQFHPNAAGSYLAALTLFARLSGRVVPPLRAAARVAEAPFRSVQVTDEQFAVLHAAAARAVR